MSQQFDKNNDNDIKYFQDILWDLKKRSDDKRTQVSAVILNETGEVLSYGVNTFPLSLRKNNLIDRNGLDFEVEYEPFKSVMLNKRDIIIHAEKNALKGLKNKLENGKPHACIVTHFPCEKCASELVDEGIKIIYTFNQRTNSQHKFENKTKAILALAGVELVILPIFIN